MKQLLSLIHISLNAAGIGEGYFSNGTSTFKPSNTLTRGQLSAIVWRMRNYDCLLYTS